VNEGDEYKGKFFGEYIIWQFHHIDFPRKEFVKG
jgi:hypothetical protein